MKREDTTISPITDGDDVATSGDIQSTSQNGGQIAGFRNWIMNGDFQVWQRGPGPHKSTVSFKYGPDRWRNFSNSNNTLTRTGFGFPKGFDYGCRVTNEVDGYSNNLGLAQAIELVLKGGKGEPFTSGTTWTFSCISTATSLNLDVAFGKGGYEFLDNVVSNVAMTQVSVYEGNWFTYEHTFTFPDSNPDPECNCLWVRPRTNGQETWDITGCQLELGTRTPFERRPKALEYQMCQRYFQTSVNRSWDDSSAIVETGLTTFIPTNAVDFQVFNFPTFLRTPPTVSVKNKANAANKARRTGGGTDEAIMTITNVNSQSFSFTTDKTAQRTYAYAWRADADF